MFALATSFQEPDTISFYNIVVFIHIMAAIVAFGVTFAYPIVDAILHRPGNLKHLGWWHRVQGELGGKLITLSASVVLLAGLYMSAAGPYDFGKTFVSIGIVIIVVLLGVGGAFFAPTETVKPRDAVGRVGAELVTPYPPGIPVIAPGEVYSEAAIAYLEEVVANGAFVEGAADSSVSILRVVAD